MGFHTLRSSPLRANHLVIKFKTNYGDTSDIWERNTLKFFVKRRCRTGAMELWSVFCDAEFKFVEHGSEIG